VRADPEFKACIWDKRISDWVRREGIFSTRRTYERVRFNTPWHRHIGVEILYCDGGEGVLAVGPNVFPYSIGTLALFHSETPHRVRMRNRYFRWNLCFLPEAIGLEADLPARLLDGLRIGGNPQQAYVASVTREDDDRRIRNLFADLHQEAAERRPGFRRILALRLCELLLLFERFLEQSVAAPGGKRPLTSEPLLHEILAYVENHLSGDISVRSIARRFHLSESHLYRLMYSATGQSPSQYIISRRIERARYLLANSPLTISEVARAVGITSTSYFSQLFKRHAGCTPRSYRERSLA